MYRHLDHHWSSLARGASAVAALTDGHPRKRSEPKRAADSEQVRCGDDFWLWRLKQSAFCPTVHGPRRPRETWQTSREMDRRFGRDLALLPVLEVNGRSPFAEALGIRGEPTASTFSVDDAATLLGRLAVLFPSAGDTRRALRDLRGVCRQLVELLAGHAPAQPARHVELPAMIGDKLTWLPAERIFYAERRRSEPLEVPIFVLEAEPRAKAPLSACFGVRVLDECLKRSPEAGDPALDDVDLDTFRGALWARGPSLLARLAAERQEEGRAAEDARLMRAFLRGVLPVQGLIVCTSLDGATLGAAGGESAGSYVDRASPACAFVRWGPCGWPPTPEDAERLADALCQLYGPNWYEPFLALVQCADDAARLRVLRRAGAPTDLAEFARRLEQEVEAPPAEVRTTALSPTPGTAPVIAAPPPRRPTAGDDTPSVPLWHVENLRVMGMTVTLPCAEHDGDRSDENRHRVTERLGGGHGGRHNHTDLEALDELGMAVAIAFEEARLARVGGGRVYDVSSPQRILAGGDALKAVFVGELQREGVGVEWPGFDLLSVDAQGRAVRLIELKSSGVAARVQECTWNEWKTAGRSALRERYYLYLVGNLRSDLVGQVPYVRTVKDPFGQLRAEVQLNTRVERRVQLWVTRFVQAEEERLEIVRASAPEPHIALEPEGGAMGADAGTPDP